MKAWYKICIQGRVQGVGFRPFVYRKAMESGISGSVSNNEEGVLIYAGGTSSEVRKFYTEIVEHPPEISRISGHRIEKTISRATDGFRIVPTKAAGRLNLQLTPDFALCDACLEDLNEPGNRRQNYPFTSCTNCGPRWSITRSFPFERGHTTMQEFPQCTECKNEYIEPFDRRFHSQTNSCPNCGIRYWLTEAGGEVLSLKGMEIFRQMGNWLEAGRILAVKNTCGYLLCCDARNPKVIQELRRKKRRPVKPFALLYPSLELLNADIDLSISAAEALLSPERPIALLPAGDYRGTACLPEIAPGLGEVGVMLPYSGVLALLARVFPHPMIATSGNLHGSPICSEVEEAESRLMDVADCFFHHNLDIVHSQDDSVMRFVPDEGSRILLRRSRGFAPNLSYPAGKGAHSDLLAMGGELKSSVGFIPNDFLYLSQYLGNLEHYEVYNRFTRSVSEFTRIFNTEPRAVLVDAHLGYHSTQYGQEIAAARGLPLTKIQHHKAHFAAVLGENQLLEATEPVLGVIWDGTGYGDDGTIWGGEFLSYQSGKMQRVGQLSSFPWLAGDKMAREPRLSLLAIAGAKGQGVAPKFKSEELKIYARLREQGSLQTSSMGRLFDAVASLMNLCDRNTFEGEAAMRLETIAARSMHNRSYLHLNPKGDIPANHLLQVLGKELASGRPQEEVAGSFLFTLASLILEKAKSIGYGAIALSGGVFQNAYLVGCLQQLNKGRFRLYFHKELSPNDENIAYGQLMYYLYCNP